MDVRYVFFSSLENADMVAYRPLAVSEVYHLQLSFVELWLHYGIGSLTGISDPGADDTWISTKP
jgi:hypothetical protein